VSGLRSGIRAAVSAALLICATAGAAGAQNAEAATGTLPGGVAYQLRPDPAQPAAAVALWYRAPAGGFDAAPTPGLARLAAATVTASAPITGTSLAQLVERAGGRLSISAFPDSIAITALVPPDRVAQTVRAMTADFFAPVATADGLAIGRRDAGEDALLRSLEPDAIEDALGAALFAAGPFHDGALPAAALSDVTLDRVRAFADRAFRPSNAVLVLAGNVDRAALAGVATRSGDTSAASPEPATAQTPAPRVPAAPELRRTGNITGTGLGWIGPPIADEGAATALDFLADALFAPKTGIVARALGTRKATVTGRFVTYHDPGVFLVTVTGDDAAAARPIVEQAVVAAATPMAGPAFSAARAGFVYRLLGTMESPAEIADTYGWYAVEGDAAYAPADGGLQGRYFTLAAKLTPASVAQAAARYLSGPPAAVTFVKAAPEASPAPRAGKPPA
jgi:predicted Zn-dependent peptidase